MFNTKLRDLRIKKNITQKELSKHLGVSDRTVGYYETGERIPPADVLIKIANYFNVSLDYLLDRPINNNGSIIDTFTSDLKEVLSDDDAVFMFDDVSNTLYYISRLDPYDNDKTSIFSGIHKLSQESQEDLLNYLKLLELRDMQRRNQANNDSKTSD